MENTFECCGLPKNAMVDEHENYHIDANIDLLPIRKLQALEYSALESLRLIFKEQKDFQKNFYNPDALDFDEKVSLSKEYILCAIRELGEVLNTLPWKTHRLYDFKSVDKKEYGEELIDVVKFILNLMIIWDMNEEDFVSIFMDKSSKVRERLLTEFGK